MPDIPFTNSYRRPTTAEGITQKAYDILQKMYNEGINLIVAGNISMLHDGTRTEDVLKNQKFYHTEISSKQLVEDLEVLKVPKNHGDNWCMFEDGSITVSNTNADLSIGNGVEYNGDKYNADILYIDPNGNCEEI